jgi:dTDP-glucose 4,6-dehydratase
MHKTVMITGACGFIGQHILEHIIKTTDYEVVGIDKLTYASNGFERLRDSGCLDNPRIKLFSTDFTQPVSWGLVKELGDINYILHVGAETHVDRSIDDPEPFVMTNVVGTMHILNLARKLSNLKKLVYFSTDEVFGPAPDGISYKEWDRYNSGNPYSATKAGGEELCLAYANTYRLPIIITHCMNAFGERQHPEKFIPSTIKKVMNGDKVIVHSNPSRTVAGSRFYIHCRNIASAVLFLLDKGVKGDKYNIVGEREIDNLSLAQFIASVIDKPLNYEMVDFHSSRPGHDLRYSLCGEKMRLMGWEPPKNFEESLTKTIKWYLESGNERWLNW